MTRSSRDLRSSASSRRSTEASPAPETAESGRFAARELGRVAGCALLLALVSLAYCYRHGYLLLYGDAVAHLHIARRIFDSRTPGIGELGSVWLPLPHLLMLPFVQKLSWWQSGVAGATPALLSYVLAVTGLYQLARFFLPIIAAVLAAGALALNPGLLYFAATAMTEPLFLAQMIWGVVLLVALARAVRAEGEARRARTLLLLLGAVLICAVFTRYDGWVFAFLAWAIACWTVLRQRPVRDPLTGALLLFSMWVGASPLLWIAYNAKQFHDPFDFLRGPYSARAIEIRTTPPGAFHYPGYHDPWVAWLYYLKVSELGATLSVTADLLLLLAVAGSVLLIWPPRRWPAGGTRAGVAITLLLWFPLPFYTYSVAYGSVPLFFPLWFPHSWYNTRYGMEMLPVFALSVAALATALARMRPRFAATIFAVTGTAILLNAAVVLRKGAVVFGEAVVNARTRVAFEQGLARVLETLPAQATILAYTSEHVGAYQDAGIALKRTINEGNYYQWQSALAEPARSAEYVVAIDGDAVAAAVREHPQGLTLLSIVCSQGQPCARVYASEADSGTSGSNQRPRPSAQGVRMVGSR